MTQVVDAFVSAYKIKSVKPILENNNGGIIIVSVHLADTTMLSLSEAARSGQGWSTESWLCSGSTLLYQGTC